MERRAAIVWSVIELISFFLLALCALFFAVIGFVYLGGAPHAFGPAPGMAAIFFLSAFLLAFVGFLLLRRSVRRLQSLRQ